MADLILDEIDEAVKRDKVLGFFKQHMKAMIAGAVVLVLAIGGWTGYGQYQKSQANAKGEAFFNALNAKGDERIKALNAIADGQSGYGTLAAFHQAQTLANVGSYEDAAGAYKNLMVNAANPLLQDLAAVYWAMNVMGTLPATTIENELKGVITAGRPFRLLGLEMIALSWAQAQDSEKAKSLFDEILKDAEATNPMRERVTSYLRIL